jgi:hypothetical protein
LWLPLLFGFVAFIGAVLLIGFATEEREGQGDFPDGVTDSRGRPPTAVQVTGDNAPVSGSPRAGAPSEPKAERSPTTARQTVDDSQMTQVETLGQNIVAAFICFDLGGRVKDWRKLRDCLSSTAFPAARWEAGDAALQTVYRVSHGMGGVLGHGLGGPLPAGWLMDVGAPGGVR